MKGAVIYARYSSERQNEQSIEGQLTVCNKFAEENDLTILDTYIDRAMTGTNDNRAAFQKMLSDAEKTDAWEIVLVYALDRFGRDSIEISVNKYKLKKAHKILLSATQRTSVNIDGTKNLDGILLENVYIGLAEYYSAELSQKVKRGLHENRMKGLCTSGTPPYGYKIIDKKAVICEEEANVIRYIFTEYYNGKVVPDIISDLTEQGIFYKGRPFQNTSVYYMLKQEKYIGIARYSDGVYYNIFPPIIDKQIFDDIQIMLENNKKGSRSTDGNFLLRGKLICGYCGRNLQGESGTSRCGKICYYYTCRGRKSIKDCEKKRVKKNDIEDLIAKVTINLFSDKKTLNKIADKILSVHEKRLEENYVIKQLKNEESETQKQINNVMKAIEAGIITPTTKNRLEELEALLAELKDKIMVQEYNNRNKITKEKIMDYLTKSLYKEPQILFNTLIHKIEVYDDKLIIYYRYTDKKNPDENQDFYFNNPNSGSNCYSVVGRDGFEPSKSLTADLQSAPFGRSGTYPYSFCLELVIGIEPTTY